MSHSRGRLGLGPPWLNKSLSPVYIKNWGGNIGFVCMNCLPISMTSANQTVWM